MPWVQPPPPKRAKNTFAMKLLHDRHNSGNKILIKKVYVLNETYRAVTKKNY